MKLYNKYGDLLIGLIKDNDSFYNDNKRVLDIYYYNLYKLINNGDITNNEAKKIISMNLLNIRCTFMGEKVTYKKCYLLIVKYLFDLNIIKNEDDLDKLNSCDLNSNYVVASFDFDSLRNKNCYHLEDDVIGGLSLNNKCLYYYVGNILREELEYFVKEINKKFDNES